MSSLKRAPKLRLDLLRFLDGLLVGAIALVSILLRTISILNYPQWPLMVNEFDPWYLFYNALLIAQAGGNWYAVPPDVKAWFPWGFAIELGDTIGLPFLVALFSLPLYSAYGPSAVYTVSIFSDIVLDALGVLAAFLAVESLTNSRVGGYFAALFVALSPALTYKNLLGGLPKTSWGAVFVLFTIYFLVQGIKRDKWYLSVIGGGFLFLAEISWGGYTYIDISLFIAALLLIFLNKNDEVTAKNVSALAVTTAFLTSFAPNNIGFMSEIAHGLSLVLVSLFLYADLYLKKIIPSEISESRSLLITAAIVGLLAIVSVVAPIIGLNPIPSRYYAIVNPFYQFSVPIDRTVAEYIPESAQQLLMTFGLPLLLSVPGAYFLLRQRINLASLWLLVLGVASVYGTSEQPYLFNYTAYIVAALAGVAVSDFIRNMLEANRLRAVALVFLAFLAVGMASDASFTMALSDVPPSLANAALPYAVTNYAWVEALGWIHNNTPSNAFVLSWWDYGYWIQVVGNRSVIDENNTLNGTQIKLMAEMFLNNDTFAANVLERDFHLYPLGSPNYTVPVYIVAYDTATLYVPSNSFSAEWFIGLPVNFPGTFYGYTTSVADIAKAMGAMTVIAGYNQTEYINNTLVLDTLQPIISVLNSSVAAQNPSLASAYASLANQIESASVTAWTPKAYNSMIVSMFVEGLQYTGFPVVAPFSVPLSTITGSSSTLQGVQLPKVYMAYFKPVLIELYPIGATNAVGGFAEVYVVVVVYQFVEPWVVVNPQVVVVNNSA